MAAMRKLRCGTRYTDRRPFRAVPDGGRQYACHYRHNFRQRLSSPSALIVLTLWIVDRLATCRLIGPPVVGKLGQRKKTCFRKTNLFSFQLRQQLVQF